MASILVVEDEGNLRHAIAHAMTRAGHEVAQAGSAPAAWDLCRGTDFDVVLTDVNLGEGEDGFSLIQRLRDETSRACIIVMTGYGSVEHAVRAMKLGADDYLQKPVNLDEMALLIERAVGARRERSRLDLYDRLEEVAGAGQDLVGESPRWREAVALAERLSRMPLPARGPGSGRPGGALPTVLLLGETGTGKGVLARHIHQCAAGRDAAKTPFVHINCTSLPPSLIESELFGHEKGAFTDAKAAREGLFGMADGGTIFLDEIGDMPAALQTKLLVVIEQGTYRRVGGSRDRSVCARVIAATNQDLDAACARGDFRRDLLYRMNAFTITLPPLRERGDDAVLLAETLLERFGREYGRAGLVLTDSARGAIASHAWPGNVRELVNVCQRAAMLAPSDEVSAADLGLAQRSAAQGALAPAPGWANGDHAPELVFDFRRGVHTADEVEKQLIIQALKEAGGNVSRAARLVGMQRSSFRYRIERHGLQGVAQELTRR